MQKTGATRKELMTQVMLLDGRTQILVRFRLAEQLYALPIDHVDQITEMVAIVPLPQVNHSVEGVINVRGTFVPAINLRRHLGLPGVALGLDIHIILVDVSGRKLGLIVDEVVDVFSLDKPLAAPGDVLPDNLGELGLLHGLAHTEEGLMFVLDLEQLFHPAQVKALTRVFDTLPELVEATEAAAFELAAAHVEQGV
jgi:purine-binding chemotaxis protein CheW